MNWFRSFWQSLFDRSPRLAKVIDVGHGQPVILLHGIGRSSQVWQYLISELADRSLRLVAFDLLGFGASPKPPQNDYSLDEHVRAVISAIRRSRVRQPVILVGHSMGCLVAVRVAKVRPDLVRHLVLYEMPLYDGLPEKRRYRARLNVYFRFYEWVTKQQPTFGEARQRFSQRLATKIAGSELTAETWQPFVKSLQNVIMTQTAGNDIKQLAMPTDVIYGSRDMFVIRGKVEEVFGTDTTNITTHTIRERHVISKKAARFLAERILNALAVP